MDLVVKPKNADNLYSVEGSVVFANLLTFRQHYECPPKALGNLSQRRSEITEFPSGGIVGGN